MSTVIKADGLSKSYIIDHNGEVPYGTLRDALASRIRRAALRLVRPADTRTGLESTTREEFWALRDVSFTVQQGERVGLIGRNGAGKSTLLKILSRITEPTRGSVEIHGRVASLLEVGTGFHPELTGRENIYLNGAILGMRKTEIRRKFDEIVDFAEVEKFLDTPVKRYSSGMYVRLAFAVAAHLEPEVLIVDEVLAVGDTRFQEKCLGKMRSIGSSGRTLIFVSHNMRVIAELCDRAYWIDSGMISSQGEPRLVIKEYLANGLRSSANWEPPPEVAEGAFQYHGVWVTGDGFDANGATTGDTPVEIHFEYSILRQLPEGRLAFILVNQEGVTVLSSSSTDETPTLNRVWPIGRTHVKCTIPGMLLPPGRYSVTIATPSEAGNYTVHENAIGFTILELNTLTARDNRTGVLAPLLLWQVLRQNSSSHTEQSTRNISTDSLRE